MNDDRAFRMGQQFDASFAAPPPALGQRREEILVIGLGSRRYGLRLSQIEAVVRGKTVTPLPGSPPDQLGLAGFRGRLVTVFDLVAWLGHERGEGGWLALVRTAQGHQLALSFDGLEQQLSLAPEQLLGGGQDDLVDCLIQRPEGTLTVLSLTMLLNSLAQRLEVE